MEKINYKLLAWLSVLLLVLLIVFYVIEFDYIGNTIGFNHLVVKSLVVAFFAGILLGLHFQKVLSVLVLVQKDYLELPLKEMKC